MNTASVKTRPRGRPRSDEDQGIARETILEAALGEFAAVGYEGFSSRKLARDLGVSHGLINIRFGSKDQLWRACVDWSLESIAARMKQTPQQGSVQERFRSAVILLLFAIEAVPALLQLVNHEGASESRRLSYITDTIIAERYRVLEDIVKEGNSAGLFRDVPDQLIFVMVSHGGGALFAMKPLAKRLGLLTKGDATELEKRAGEIADLMLRGLLI